MLGGMQSNKINKLVYASVLGATVLMSSTSAFAQERNSHDFRNSRDNNNQPSYYQNYYQNFFPQNWFRNNGNDNRNSNGQNSQFGPFSNRGNNHNDYNRNPRDNNYISNCNNEQYVDREDMNTNLDINRDGQVVIRNATVNSQNGNNMTLTSTLGSATLTWTLVLDNGTRFESRNGRQIDPREINIGDKVTVKGKLMSGSALTVDADLIRNTFRSSHN